MLWTEKYRPTSLDEMILPSEVSDLAAEYLEQKAIPNLLFIGGPGCGKTTLAKILVNSLDGDYIFINGSNERNIDTLREKVTDFVTRLSVTSPDAMKYVILDEADNLNPTSFQPALRAFMEQHSSSVRFILTANFVNQIIEPLRSRCTNVMFNIPKEEKQQSLVRMYKRVEAILKEENCHFIDDKESLRDVIVDSYPDWRSLLNVLQKTANIQKSRPNYTVKHAQMADNISVIVDGVFEKNFGKCRKLIAENSSMSTEALVRGVVTSLLSSTKLLPECHPNIFIVANDALYKDKFVADKEIGRAAFIAEIIDSCEWST